MPHLNKVFANIECDENMFNGIRLPSFVPLEKIGKLSEKTGIPFSEVYLNGPRTIFEVQCDICENDLGWEDTSVPPPKTVLELAKLYAFARCNANEEKTRSLYADVQKYLLRDDMFSALQKHGFSADEAYSFSRNWHRGDKKQSEIKTLEYTGVPTNLIYVFRMLYNQWSLAPCLARVNALLMLKAYENHVDNMWR